jgi:hypothetical protein
MSSQKKKLVSLSIAQKYQIVKHLDAGRAPASIAAEYSITVMTVSRTKAAREKITQEYETGVNNSAKRHCSSI